MAHDAVFTRMLKYTDKICSLAPFLLLKFWLKQIIISYININTDQARISWANSNKQSFKRFTNFTCSSLHAIDWKNHLGWKKPLRSRSPSINLVLSMDIYFWNNSYEKILEKMALITSRIMFSHFHFPIYIEEKINHHFYSYKRTLLIF